VKGLLFAHMVEKSKTVKIVKVVLFAYIIKQNQNARSVMGLAFVFMENKKRGAESVVVVLIYAKIHGVIQEKIVNMMDIACHVM
jgi:hypothetical protein